MHARRREPQPKAAPALREVPSEVTGEPAGEPAGELAGAADPASLIEPGALVHGRYRLSSLLGRGGMGVVYRARDLALDRDVAVKVLRAPERASLRARFRRETQLASRVHHPHAVYVVDAGELPDGSGFLVMELLKGRTLRAVLAECGRMEPRRACRIGAMIASGMQSIHDAGIVHRDLKPANIFLLAEGAADFVKIVDFGVARELELAGAPDATVSSAATQDSGVTQDSGESLATQSGGSSAPLTRHGAIVGTLRYMAPEQLRGEAVDARADQYALGCMLYEMLTGVPPFSGEGSQVARGHLYGELIAPRRLAPEAAIAPELEAVVLRAMSRQAAGRFAQMQELGAALTAQADGPGPFPRSPSRLRSAWRPLCIGALSVLLATAGLVLTLSQQRRAVPGRAEVSQSVSSGLRPVPLPAPEAPTPPSDRPATSPDAGPPTVQQAQPESAAGLPPRRPPAPTPRREAAPRAADPDSVTGVLARATAALGRQDRPAAQRLLQSLRGRCARATSAPGCAEHAGEIAVQLGRLHESSGHWAEALTEYSRALESLGPAGSSARQPAWRQEAEAAAVRLMPRLGRVVLRRTSGGRCEEVSMFLPPGEHVLAIDGESRTVQVRARETQRLGSCAPP
ncbi:MAG: protein kinase [Polyangia bacterium]